MKRLGRPAGRAALATFGVLAVAACSSADIQCGPCPGRGSYIDPNGVIGPHDQVASVRVCLDSVCRTVRNPDSVGGPAQYANIYGLTPRSRDRIENIEITTFDTDDNEIRVETATSLDLPGARSARDDPCACFSVRIFYDRSSDRFVVSSR